MRLSTVLRGALAVLATTTLAFLPAAGPGFLEPAPAQAADLTQFNPGDIMSDEVLYASNRMNVDDIQSFLNTQGKNCVPGADGTACLKNYRVNTHNRTADDHCDAYAGAHKESAAQVIAKVAKACGINPQVLLVTLQKEQGLVKGTGSGLYANRYHAATGYKCLTGVPCDVKYKGFFKQVYMTAWRMKDYGINPKNFTFRPGLTLNINYHPNGECGSSPVTLANQATATLYNYTPYQPNAAALAAGYGTGDQCSAYGNRNFYNYFTDWFGPTH